MYHIEKEGTHREYPGKSAVTFQDSHKRIQHGGCQQLQNLQDHKFFLLLV